MMLQDHKDECVKEFIKYRTILTFSFYPRSMIFAFFVPMKEFSSHNIFLLGSLK